MEKTSHATVGHTYQNVLHDNVQTNSSPTVFREKKIDEVLREKKVRYQRSGNYSNQRNSTAAATTADSTNTASCDTPQITGIDELNGKKVHLNVLDMYWFWKLMEGNTPLYAELMSKYFEDPLPWICFRDPISRSPTNNDVVRETMIRTMSECRKSI